MSFPLSSFYTPTIVTLHDDAEGYAAGWNPGNVPITPLQIPPIISAPPFGLITIKSPVELEGFIFYRSHVRKSLGVVGPS